MKVKTPKRLQDCNIEQIGRWIEILNNLGIKDPTELLQNFSLMVDVVSIFSGLRPSLVRTITPSDLTKIYLDLLQMLSQFEEKEPEGVVSIEGVKYILNKDFKKITTGQVIDIKMIETPYKHPAQVMAILYNEEGFTYGQTNDKGVMIKPTDQRKKLFAEKFPVNEFINVMGFFLNSYEKRNEALALIQIVKTEKTITEIQNQLKTEIQAGQSRPSGFFGRNKSNLLAKRRTKRLTR